MSEQLRPLLTRQVETSAYPVARRPEAGAGPVESSLLRAQVRRVLVPGLSISRPGQQDQAIAWWRHPARGWQVMSPSKLEAQPDMEALRVQCLLLPAAALATPRLLEVLFTSKPGLRTTVVVGAPRFSLAQGVMASLLDLSLSVLPVERVANLVSCQYPLGILISLRPDSSLCRQGMPVQLLVTYASEPAAVPLQLVLRSGSLQVELFLRKPTTRQRLRTLKPKLRLQLEACLPRKHRTEVP